MNARQFGVAFAALLAGASAGAHAQIYKWVDENGVTNYAGKPPVAAQSAKELDVVPERISIYAQDPAVLRALETASASRRDPLVYARIDRLERALAAERQARHDLLAAEAAAARAAYEQCLAQRRVDCETESLGGYSPPPVAPAQFRRRQRPFVAEVTLNGVTAGNVTAAIRNARRFDVDPEARAAIRPAASARAPLRLNRARPPG
ncbi:MAG: DUF4124 domain-containing protein [Betaproteobacteria bacterium]|nr:DUF4124 domain-containing protein [Betaproteobacteria bacterium]MBI2960513.1 DUF4124 domain-containing protein [Betaproteobacteria bacterium]